jgi:hypothetical protein
MIWNNSKSNLDVVIPSEYITETESVANNYTKTKIDNNIYSKNK